MNGRYQAAGSAPAGAVLRPRMTYAIDGQTLLYTYELYRIGQAVSRLSVLQVAQAHPARRTWRCLPHWRDDDPPDHRLDWRGLLVPRWVRPYT